MKNEGTKIGINFTIDKQSIVREEKKYKLNRPITGVIHKDRIWEQWYDQEALKTKLPKMNQRDYLFFNNQGFEDQVILNNRGLKKITVAEFKIMVNLYTQALASYEIGLGDKVCSIGLTTPELITLKYAAATRGIITSHLNFADATATLDHNKIYKQLKTIRPRMIFYLDIFESKVSEILNLPEFRDIQKVQMPLCASTTKNTVEKVVISLLKAGNKIRNLNVHERMLFSEFIRSGKRYDKIVDSIYYQKMPANIAFTSATTGDSKAVVLSHDANNALALQHKIANLGLERGKRNLVLVPPFLAFWDADIIHMAMCLGIENILELSLTYENVPKYLMKYLPDYGIWSQYLWDSVLHMKKEDQEILEKYIEKAVVGGERAEINQQKRFLKNTGILQVAGYGTSEMDSCFSVAHPNCNVIGSAGLPLPFNNIRIKDADFQDLTYNQPGRAWITGPAMMNGYYHNPGLTSSVLYTDEDGVIWYNTNDYAYVDMTGSIVPIDRDAPPITVQNNHQEITVKLLDIAEKVKEHPAIKLCKFSSSNGNIIMHLTLDEFFEESTEEILSSLMNFIEKTIPEFEQPDCIQLLDTFPRTPLGKVDYRKLQEMADSLLLEFSEIFKNSSKLNLIDCTNSTKNDKIYKKCIL